MCWQNLEQLNLNCIPLFIMSFNIMLKHMAGNYISLTQMFKCQPLKSKHLCRSFSSVCRFRQDNFFSSGSIVAYCGVRQVVIQNVRNRLCHTGGKKIKNQELLKKNRSTLYYMLALGVATVGFSYAAVPLYRIFCQAYSYGGTTSVSHDGSKVDTMNKVAERVIRVRFNADTASSMQWNFKPEQKEIKLSPGETALAFYTAKNPTNRPVTGVSTYNVVPFQAGQYFNKIQCFCFEEQMLNPGEEVYMPVFFYIDPEFADDPVMQFVDEITLSYTFFEARPGVQLPFLRSHAEQKQL